MKTFHLLIMAAMMLTLNACAVPSTPSPITLLLTPSTTMTPTPTFTPTPTIGAVYDDYRDVSALKASLLLSLHM